MIETIEKKAIENWKVDKEIFDNLNVGDKVSENRVVCHKYKNGILAGGRWNFLTDSITTINYEWDGNIAKADPKSWHAFYNEESWCSRKENYQKFNAILTEAGL